MSRRCTREGVEWHRRKDRGENPIGDPLVTREGDYFLRDGGFAFELLSRREHKLPDHVGDHLRDPSPLP